MHYLQLNGKRPKNLAASALAATDKKGKILAAGGEDHGRQCSISQRMAQNRGKPDEVARAKAEEAHVRRTLRAAIINGAAMYNAEDAEACLKMFVHTAETVLTLTRSQLIANAITRSGGGGRPIRDRVWMLRSAFDTLLDEIGDGEADLATVVGDGSQAAANVENTRFTNQSAAARTSMTSLTMPKLTE
uniref:Uncharacterized protein n=1 Tax=Prymnesium polylepis TaxID=72548 RepID=A0A7S4HFM3_9EUKA